MRSVQTDLWCVPLHQPSPRLLTSVTTSPSCSSTSYSELAGNGTMHLQMIHFQRSDVLYKNFQFPSFFIDKDDFQQLKWFKTWIYALNSHTAYSACTRLYFSPRVLDWLTAPAWPALIWCCACRRVSRMAWAHLHIIFHYFWGENSYFTLSLASRSASVSGLESSAWPLRWSSSEKSMREPSVTFRGFPFLA